MATTKTNIDFGNGSTTNVDVTVHGQMSITPITKPNGVVSSVYNPDTKILEFVFEN